MKRGEAISVENFEGQSRCIISADSLSLVLAKLSNVPVDDNLMVRRRIMKNMKIGIVSNLYPPMVRGGAELVAQRIADELYSRGHKVFVLSTKKYSGISSLFPQITERQIEDVYRFYPLNLYHLTEGNKPFLVRALWHLIDLFSPLPAKAMKLVIEKEKPDIIITHNLKGIGLKISKTIQKKKIFHIHTLHDVQLSVPSGLLMYGNEKTWLNESLFRTWYERTIEKVFGLPNVFISPSRFLAQFYKERGMFKKVDVKVIPNPVSLKIQAMRKERIPGPVRLVFVGQLEMHKGITLLLEAMNDFGDEVELYIAGTGSLEEYVNEWCRRDSRIHRHGFVSMGNLNKLLAFSDVMVLPSICYENSPTIIYESFCVGVPVLAASIGGIPELVKDGENGWLFEPGNKKNLVRKIQDLIDNKEKYWDWTEKIQKEAEKHSVKKYVDELEKLFPL